jgi:hypothetical protein
MAQWSKLPDDILGLVYNKLDVQDILSLAATSKAEAIKVCVSGTMTAYFRV